MPRVPRLLSTVTAPPARGRIEAAQVVPEAVARLGEQGFRIGGLIAEVEIKRNEAANEADADRMMAMAESQADALTTELEASPDPRTHRERALQGFQEIGNQLLSEAQNESVRQRLEPRLYGLAGRLDRQARKTANKWVIDQSQAAHLQLGAIKEQQSIRTADPQERDAILGELDAAWDARVAQGVYAADIGEKGKQATRKRVRMGVLNRLVYDDPDAATKELAAPEFSDLTEQERLQLDLNIERRKRQIVEDRDRQERRVERILKDERDIHVRELVSLARDGKLTLRQLDEEARLYQMGREDYDRIRDHMEKGPTVASNPDTLKRMTLDVRTRPREALTGELARLYQTDQLNRVDYERLDNELQTLLTSGKASSALTSRHNQAEQIIRQAYGADNPFFRRLQGAEIDTALALAMEELTTRSSKYNGSEDPLVVAEEIIPKYLVHIPGAMEARIKLKVSQARFKTIQELGPRDQAGVKGLTDQQWRDTARQLKEIQDLQQGLEAYRVSKQPRPTGGPSQRQ